MTLPFAGLARARARMIGGRLEGEAQKWNQDQEEAQRLFREWATRKQLDDTASERQASREWQQNVFTEGQREREQARADQAAWRQQQAEDAKAYRDAQMQENARLQKERLTQQRDLANQQNETRQMLGALARSGQTQQAPAPVRITVEERKAAALLNQASNAFGAIEQYKPSLKAQQASKVPIIGNVLAGKLDEGGQAAQQAGYQFADAYMRYVSGAAVPEPEVRRYMTTFMPQPGDSPATVARKKSARNAIMQSLRIGAGRAVNPNAPETELPTDNMPGRQYSPHNPFAR